MIVSKLVVAAVFMALGIFLLARELLRRRKAPYVTPDGVRVDVEKWEGTDADVEEARLALCYQDGLRIYPHIYGRWPYSVFLAAQRGEAIESDPIPRTLLSPESAAYDPAGYREALSRGTTFGRWNRHNMEIAGEIVRESDCFQSEDDYRDWVNSRAVRVGVL